MSIRKDFFTNVAFSGIEYLHSCRVLFIRKRLDIAQNKQDHVSMEWFALKIYNMPMEFARVNATARDFKVNDDFYMQMQLGTRLCEIRKNES
uniref:Uncharacterized protein n=1 Tax=Timema bartmani TaxID=61472 RepID=A0A7R9FAP0_9NEOP|nr:unnamed protein product [Timema bartmani]